MQTGTLVARALVEVEEKAKRYHRIRKWPRGNTLADCVVCYAVSRGFRAVYATRWNKLVDAKLHSAAMASMRAGCAREAKIGVGVCVRTIRATHAWRTQECFEGLC